MCRMPPGKTRSPMTSWTAWGALLMRRWSCSRGSCGGSPSPVSTGRCDRHITFIYNMPVYMPIVACTIYSVQCTPTNLLYLLLRTRVVQCTTQVQCTQSTPIHFTCKHREFTSAKNKKAAKGFGMDWNNEEVRKRDSQWREQDFSSKKMVEEKTRNKKAW